MTRMTEVEPGDSDTNVVAGYSSKTFLNFFFKDFSLS